MGVHLMRSRRIISDHEKKLGTKNRPKYSARNITPGTPVSEQYLLDLEREAFKSLWRRKKDPGENQFSRSKTGKTLRN